MPLSPKTSPVSVSTDTSVDDRRASVRFPCELESSCSPITTNRATTWSGKIRDISRGGMGIVLSRRFELGTLLNIEIQEPDGTSSGVVLARVVHVTPHSTGGWVIGCCFTNELDDDEVKSLVRDPLL